MEYEILQMKRAGGDGLPAIPDHKRARSPTPVKLGNVPLGLALPASAAPHVPPMNPPPAIAAGSHSQALTNFQAPPSPPMPTPTPIADSSASRTAADTMAAEQYEQIYGAQLRELRAKSEQVDILKQHVEVIKESATEAVAGAQAQAQAAAGAAMQAQAASQAAQAREAEAPLHLDAAGMRVDELERRSAHQTVQATYMNQKYLQDTQILKNDIANKDATISNLHAQLGSAMAGRDDAERRVAEATTANSNAVKLNEGLKRQIHDVTRDMEEAKVNYNRLHAESHTLVAERDSRITDLSQRLTESQVALDRVQSNLAALQAAPPPGEAAAELARLRACVAAEREAMAGMTTKLN